MKIIFFIVQALLLSLVIYSQQTPKTPEEMEVFLKNLQKKADSMQQALKVKNYNNPDKTVAGGLTKSGISTAQPGNEPDNKKLPPKDSARIKTIPKKNFTLTELNSYLSTLHDQLKKRFPADVVASAHSIAQKLNNDPAKLEAASLHAWQNGADEEAILLITKAASSGGSDGLLLTNAGAMLDMYGLSEKAVPVLRAVVSYGPQNVIALNDLAQAFTALGMQDSAQYYFSRCLGLSPQHPEANNTAGLIELQKGNKTKAQTYFENSLRGSFNISAYTGLKTILKEKTRIANLIKPKVKMPEYFNQFKYKPPRQCLNVNEAATVKQEFDSYKKMLSDERGKYDKLKKEAGQTMRQKSPAQYNEALMNKAMMGESYMRPFQSLGWIMEAETILEYHDDIADLEKFNKENREGYKLLEKEYKDAYEQMMKSGSHDCAKENELKNKYLERFAQLNEEWQGRNMLIENKYIDDLLYWCYFSAFDENDYRHRFYTWVYNYLYKVNWLAQVKILEPCEETEPKEVEQPEQKELKEFDCPVDVEIPFVVGKLTMNCEKFSFKAGEGIRFKYEKKFTGQRQSTISLGIGGGVDAAVKAGPLKAGFEAGMDMAVYLTFDKAGNCTDGGMTFSASRGAGIDFSAGERIKIKKDLGYVGEEIGWRFGINSGVSFTPPKNPFEKPEVQVNPNVRIYQPN